MLAARLMRDQGIHIEDINFFTGFCVEGRPHAIRASLEFLRPLLDLAIRLYVASVFRQSGLTKIADFDTAVALFALNTP